MDLVSEALLLKKKVLLREAKPGGSRPGGFPLLSGKVQIVSRTLSGLFLVGAVSRPRKTSKAQIGKIPKESPKKSGKSGKIGKGQTRTKKDKKGRTSPDRETPPFENPPRLAALDSYVLDVRVRCQSCPSAAHDCCQKIHCFEGSRL